MIGFHFSRNHILEIMIVFLAILFKYISIWNILSGSLKYLVIIFAIGIAILILSDKKYTKKQMMIIFIFFCLSCIITYSSKEIDFIISLLLAIVFSKKDNGDYKFVKYFVLSSCICYILTVLFNFLGIVEGTSAIRNVDGIIVLRNSLGFEHVNAVFKNFLPIALGIYLLCKVQQEKKILKLVIIIEITAFILFSYTNCRTGFMVILLLIPYTLFEGKLKKMITLRYLKYLFAIFTIASFLIAHFFGNPFGEINLMLSNRPFLWNNIVHLLKISIFNNPMFQDYVLDNMYLWLLYNYGLVTYLTYLVIFYLGTKKMSKNKNFFIIILLFSIYALFENLNVYNYNFLLVLQMMYLLANDNKMYWLKNSYKIKKENGGNSL